MLMHTNIVTMVDLVRGGASFLLLLYKHDIFPNWRAETRVSSLYLAEYYALGSYLHW